MGFLELLTVLFVALKLTGIIGWSWWLVFAPLYVYLVLIALYLAILLATMVIGAFHEKSVEDKKRK